MSRNRGRAWRRLRAYTIATQPAICWICGDPIDVTLPRTNPLSVEVDHVHPVALGGLELDPSNLRVTHKQCNRSKGIKHLQAKTSRRW